LIVVDLVRASSKPQGNAVDSNAAGGIFAPLAPAASDCKDTAEPEAEALSMSATGPGVGSIAHLIMDLGGYEIWPNDCESSEKD
jgi:hypothetical protein